MLSSMRFAVIIFSTESESLIGTGSVYGWYESLATALNTATNLNQSGKYWNAVALKML